MNLVAHTSDVLPPPRTSQKPTGRIPQARRAVQKMLDGEVAYFTFELEDPKILNRIRSAWNVAAKSLGTRVSIYRGPGNQMVVTLKERL